MKSPTKPKVVLTSGDYIGFPETAGNNQTNEVQPKVLLTSPYDDRGHGLPIDYEVTSSNYDIPSNPKLKIIKINNSKITSTSSNMGHVVYKIPSEMSVRNTYQVIVRISKSTVNIYENINGEVRTSSVPISETMEVKLIDPSPDDAKMFNVVPDNNGIQLVENNESITQWTWNITPLKSGTAQLKIMIAVITNGNKKETVYEDTVKVNTDLGKQIPFFFGQYWQWLLSTLVIPFGVWFYNRKKKDKKK